ncbi:sulfatase [Marinobacter sp. 1_MG-2023]|uniref:sulfatase n=1 Tax=Marinobacter sp. 1_MG-2023 TaxID=3062627 RepID=UPI0026E2A935|nr:sulfatase [Marinobacter sp. 1_MG-2023]MDO6824785.1 sulfatase [Marinobacter sp. 1_MG-2023]
MLFWLLLLNSLLLIPAIALPGSMPWLSIEAIALWALLCLLPRRYRQNRFTITLAVIYSSLAFLVLVDALVRESLGRGLNLYLEAGLLGAAWNLLETNLGSVIAALALLLLVGFLASLGWLFHVCLKRIQYHSSAGFGKPLLFVSGLVIAGAITPFIGSPALAFMANQASLMTHTHQTTEAFVEQLRNQPETSRTAQPLTQLAGRDVILGFIESYGISTLTDDRYRMLIDQRLELMEQELDSAGLTIVTGRLQSPVQGGQSWLGHLSVLSGQWIENQLAYETLLSSNYPTLVDDFRGTGHKTVAVMPAITRAWPEGRLLRYEYIYDHDNMGYRGPAFNWVTMPDQYTWRWLQQLRERTPEPLLVELALISSHAPWVPVLPVLADWEAIGDGEVFERWRGAGEAPASLWRDTERVRDHYGKAIDYALNVASNFATRYVEENTLMIILGDHQPAPLITGENASRDVIVHIISGDPGLVTPFLSGELPGFQPGTRPDLQATGAPMNQLRPFLHKHFGNP